MAESKPVEAPKSSQAESKSAEKPQAGADPGKGLGGELAAHHAARTTVPGRDGVDARLDNRSEAELEPPPSYGPDDPKPQSVDGPDLAGQIEYTRKALAERKKG